MHDDELIREAYYIISLNDSSHVAAFFRTLVRDAGFCSTLNIIMTCNCSQSQNERQI